METIEGKISEITIEDKTNRYKFTFEEKKKLNILIIGDAQIFAHVKYLPFILESAGIKCTIGVLSMWVGGITQLGWAQGMYYHYTNGETYWDEATYFSGTDSVINTSDNWNILIINDRNGQGEYGGSEINSYRIWSVIRGFCTKYNIKASIGLVIPWHPISKELLTNLSTCIDEISYWKDSVLNYSGCHCICDFIIHESLALTLASCVWYRKWDVVKGMVEADHIEDSQVDDNGAPIICAGAQGLTTSYLYAAAINKYLGLGKNLHTISWCDPYDDTTNYNLTPYQDYFDEGSDLTTPRYYNRAGDSEVLDVIEDMEQFSCAFDIVNIVNTQADAIIQDFKDIISSV